MRDLLIWCTYLNGFVYERFVLFAFYARSSSPCSLYWNLLIHYSALLLQYYVNWKLM